MSTGKCLELTRGPGGAMATTSTNGTARPVHATVGRLPLARRPRRSGDLQREDERLAGRLSQRDRQRGMGRHLAVQEVGQREPEVDPALPGQFLAVGIARYSCLPPGPTGRVAFRARARDSGLTSALP